MKKLNVLTVACTLIATLFFAQVSKAEVTISNTVNLADTTADNKEVIANIKAASKLGAFNKAMTMELDTAFDAVEVIQVDGMKTLKGVKGPDTQFLALVKTKAGKEQWVLSTTDPSAGLNAVYYPATGTASVSKLSWTQGDENDAVEIPASALK